MNELQIVKQIRFLLLSQVWRVDSGPGVSTSTGQNVFATESVVITAASTSEALLRLRAPIAMLKPTDAANDPEVDEDGSIIQGGVVLTLITSVDGDGLGENPLIGGPRGGGAVASDGRGLLESVEEIFRAVGLVNDLEGIRLQFREKSAAAATLTDDAIYQCFRDYSFQSWMTADPSYHKVTGLNSSVGGGLVTLTWNLPSDRFDRFKIRVRFVAGATAPATISDGAEAALASDLAVTLSAHNPGPAGTYSYSVFAVYDDLANPPTLVASNETAFSAPRSVTVAT